MKKAQTATDAKKPEGGTSKSGSATTDVAGSTNVRVVLRIRPMNAKEEALLETARYDAKGNKIRETCVEFTPSDKTAVAAYTIVDRTDKTDPYEKHTFNFDHVFDCSTDQAYVYDIAGKPIIESTQFGTKS